MSHVPQSEVNARHPRIGRCGACGVTRVPKEDTAARGWRGSSRLRSPIGRHSRWRERRRSNLPASVGELKSPRASNTRRRGASQRYGARSRCGPAKQSSGPAMAAAQMEAVYRVALHAGYPHDDRFERGKLALVVAALFALLARVGLRRRKGLTAAFFLRRAASRRVKCLRGDVRRRRYN